MWMENWALVAGGATWGGPAPPEMAAAGGVVAWKRVYHMSQRVVGVKIKEKGTCGGWALPLAYSTNLATAAEFYPPRAAGS